MSYDPVPPFRRDFDAARDPYTARNALGILDAGGSGGGAPDSAEYITGSADATLTNERVLTNTATVTWDLSTAGQAKANATGFGNVSNSGTPAATELAEWVDATHIKGIAKGSLSGYYLAVTGGNLTGNLSIVSSAPAISLYPSAGTVASVTASNPSTGLARWSLLLNDGAAESGGNNGSNFALQRYSDAGALLSTPISIDRATGTMTLTGYTAPNDSVSNAILANMADGTIKGRALGSGSGDPVDLTAAQAQAIIGYAEGTWTPAITFATPGDLSVAYSSRAGAYISISNLVIAWFDLTTSSFTHSTASGNLQITGLPFTCNSTVPPRSNTALGGWSGITKAGFTHFVTQANNGTTVLTVQAAGSGVALTAVTTADVASGGTILFRGMTIYRK